MPKVSPLPSDIRFTTRQSKPFLSLAIAFGSGILMGLAPAPLNLYPLAWVALAPLWVLLFGRERARSQEPAENQDWRTGGQRYRGNSIQSFSSTPHTPHPTPSLEIQPSTLNPQNLKLNPQPSPSPFVFALLWGIGYHGLALSWILGLHPLTWMGIPWMGSVAIALFCWVFITFWGAGLVISWAWVMGKLEAKGKRQRAEGRRQDGDGREGEDAETRGRGDGENSIQNSKFNIQNSHPLTRILLGTALWCSLEALWGLGSLAWTSLSYTQSPGNLLILHLGQLSGPFGVTAAIVAVNGLIAEAFIQWQGGKRQEAEGRGQKRDKGTRRQGDAENSIQHSTFNIQHSTFPYTPHPTPHTLLLTAAILLITTHLAGFELYNRSLAPSDGAALRVGIIQGNVPTRIKLYSEGVRQAEKGYTQGYEMLAEQGVEAVLTPEGALPYLWNQPNSRNSLFYQAVLRTAGGCLVRDIYGADGWHCSQFANPDRRWTGV
ncbi:hypothetical protein K9N68_28100 [Kovacikia minuta CCNUW1]|uniref:hypothetical protein n=1 Tax=Kovacikia minuta TaxID=2931930 RepID=UPI001CCB1973|nr:hypothetical protein [Kovacikia minuta]UBF25420.1 hypothetical protein K9N68_28100 [Kovacikia minuta CCNUW1]